MRRIAIWVLTLGLLGLVPLGAIGSAHAEDAAVLAKARRTVSATGLEPRPNVFFIKGRVSPKYRKGKAFMLRSFTKRGPWTRVQTFWTNNQSQFKRRVATVPRGRKRVCYRVMVPASKGYKKSFSQVLCIIRY